METKEIIKAEVTPIMEQANAGVIKSQEDKDNAVNLRKSIKDAKAKIEEKFHFVENTKKAHEAWRSAKDTENSVYTPLNDADKVVMGKVRDYDRKIAIEQQRIADEAEAKRREEERKERERLERQAEKALEKGKEEVAESLIEQAETVTVAPTFQPTVKTKKLITKVKVQNMMKLCRLIADGEVPFSVIEIAQGNLNAWAKTQDHTKKLEGLEFYQDVSR